MVIAAACGLIFAANVAVLYLLERMEKTVENQERVLALEQQLQFQAKNMEAASQLYTAQRHKVHDFRAHLNTLQGLLQNQEYDAAEQYLNSVTQEQTDRLFLVNSHHAILDALFNTKATEAIQKGIEIDFELNDLSALPFDVSDMAVLFSNLLDLWYSSSISYNAFEPSLPAWLQGPRLRLSDHIRQPAQLLA